MLVLALLAEADLYGYQFSQLILERSGGVIDVPEGSLYPMLYRLVDDGYISDTRVPTGRRRVLVYYHLEESGLSRLRDMLAEYQIFAAGLEKFIASCKLPAGEVPNHV